MAPEAKAANVKIGVQGYIDGIQNKQEGGLPDRLPHIA